MNKTVKQIVSFVKDMARESIPGFDKKAAVERMWDANDITNKLVKMIKVRWVPKWAKRSIVKQLRGLVIEVIVQALK